MNSGNRNNGQVYNYQPYQPDTIDRANIDKLQRGSTAKDIDRFSAAAEAANERTSNNQFNRDRNSAIEANRIADMAANRDTNNKIALMREDAAIKNGTRGDFSTDIAKEEVRSKSNLDYLRQNAKTEADRVFARDEADKNRYQQGLDRDKQIQIASMSQDNDRKLAAINQQTELADQQSRIQQAKISAKAQVSSAILGNQANFGGYW
jgi:hypothetical protein